MIRSTLRWLRSQERRWPIPLRGLLLFSLVLASVGGWLGVRIVHDNRMYGKWLATHGDWENVIDGGLSSNWLPVSVDNWLQESNIVLFPRCQGGILVLNGADPELVRWFARLPGCLRVELLGQSSVDCLEAVTDSPVLVDLVLWLPDTARDQTLDLSPLLQCRRQLRSLTLKFEKWHVTTGGVFAQLDLLQSVRIQADEVPAELVRELCKLRGLRELHLQVARTSTAVIAELGGLPPRATLHLDLMLPADEILMEVASIPQLVELKVSGGTATDRGVAAFERHPRLESLSLARIPGMTDAGCAVLASLPSLATLRLEGVPVTITGVQRLGEAPRLTALTLRGTQVTQEESRELETRFSGIALDWWVF